MTRSRAAGCLRTLWGSLLTVLSDAGREPHFYRSPDSKSFAKQTLESDALSSHRATMESQPKQEASFELQGPDEDGVYGPVRPPAAMSGVRT